MQGSRSQTHRPWRTSRVPGTATGHQGRGTRRRGSPGVLRTSRTLLCGRSRWLARSRRFARLREEGRHVRETRLRNSSNRPEGRRGGAATGQGSPGTASSGRRPTRCQGGGFTTHASRASGLHPRPQKQIDQRPLRGALGESTFAARLRRSPVVHLDRPSGARCRSEIIPMRTRSSLLARSLTTASHGENTPDGKVP